MLLHEPDAEELHRLGSVVAVGAHPDDETFGLGAIIATLVDRGTKVGLVCLTRGESSTLGAGPDLAERRLDELACATEILGIGDLVVGDHPDGGLAGVGPDRLAGEVVAFAGTTGALLTFDEGGITGHPDHQSATRATLIAARRLSIPVAAWAIPTPVAEALRREFGAQFVGREPEELDMVMEVDRTRQLEAIECHASQTNAVPRRRIDLTGPREHLRWLYQPTGEA